MPVAQTFTFGHSGGSVALADSVPETGGIALEGGFTVAGGATNQAEAFAWTLTLKTNSTGSPQDTVTITAGIPFIWWYGSGIPNPFAGNVTASYWSNGGTVTANVFVRVLTS